MELIVGHVTSDSARIWVRGDWKNPCLRVELHRKGSGPGVPTIVRAVWVNPARDHIKVVDLNGRGGKGPLEPSTVYDVQLRSFTSSARVLGQLRTFPREGSPDSFHFLHGSCNLSTMRLTAIGSMAAAFAGGAATNKALELPREDWDTRQLHWLLRFLSWPGVHWLSRRIVKGLNLFVLYFTRQTRYGHGKPKDPEPTKLASVLQRIKKKFRQIFPLEDAQPEEEEPSKALKMLPSPFERILWEVIPEKDTEPRPAFMIHCGDQIYFDVDYPPRIKLESGGENKSRTTPKKRDYRADYRHSYRQAWFHDESAHELLHSFPNYMILDDHEVWDGYGNGDSEEEIHLEESALAVYDEYVSQRQPDSPGRYYSFDHGDTGFFLLDTRTERWRKGRDGKMIHELEPDMREAQMEALEGWLRSKEHALKFIVSSVPFVAQLQPAGLDANGRRRSDSQSDKWSGPLWEAQRQRIISAVFENKVERLVFLTGDMHCTYHATMKIGLPHDRITVHELAGGPINQLLFAKRDDFYARYSGELPDPTFDSVSGSKEAGPQGLASGSLPKTLPWTSTLEAFHGAAPGILKVSVSRRADDASPVVEWEALRTSRFSADKRDPHSLCGRIHFPRRSSAEERK